jgi:hypothetical protein
VVGFGDQPGDLLAAEEGWGVVNSEDEHNLADLKDIEEALIEAHQALMRAMVGLGAGERERFIFKVGFARGRLERVTERIYRKADA